MAVFGDSFELEWDLIELFGNEEYTAVWAGNERQICFNVKTVLTFFTQTIPYIIILVVHRVLIMTKQHWK